MTGWLKRNHIPAGATGKGAAAAHGKVPLVVRGSGEGADMSRHWDLTGRFMRCYCITGATGRYSFSMKTEVPNV